MLRMDYPAFEVVVIDDGSRDGTLAALAPLMQDSRLRLVHKPANEGKAMALNDAIPLAAARSWSAWTPTPNPTRNCCAGSCRTSIRRVSAP